MPDKIPNSSRNVAFPSWLDNTVKVGGVLLLMGAPVVIGLLYYGIHPQAMDIGYMPVQPVPAQPSM